MDVVLLLCNESYMDATLLNKIHDIYSIAFSMEINLQKLSNSLVVLRRHKEDCFYRFFLSSIYISNQGLNM
jgi:hypothetical protein